MTTKNQEKFLAITKMEAIPFVMEGVASDATGHVISEDAAEEILTAVNAGEQATARVGELETALATAETARQTAEADLATANTTIDNLQAQIVELKKVTPAPAAAAATAEDPAAGGADEDPMAMGFQQELLNKI